MTRLLLELDPAHASLNPFDIEASKHIWQDKYRTNSEEALFVGTYGTVGRVCRAVYAKDTEEHRANAEDAMNKGLWMPGGRIIAGAGTEWRVTLFNCYVSPTIFDSMEGIADALKVAMLTLKEGGGIGMDFSSLRPHKAALRSMGGKAYSSGAVSFMDMWDVMCKQIMSAGYRRGAMMATMSCTHPDIIRFIEAKKEASRLRMFNVSVLVTDAFMNAVFNNEMWHLYFPIPPVTDKEVHTIEVPGNDRQQFVYQTIPARELWELILHTTHKYSEPGVIFIDRVNELNNLSYIENITATNPCGEQPLPPNGACNLGACNLARMVKKPFTSEATFDFDLLTKVASIGTRFLDNVIEVTRYPVQAQRQEEINKRRIGLGISGLADAMIQLGYIYGDDKSLEFASKVCQTIAYSVYHTSTLLARESGSFPLFEANKFLDRPFVKKLPDAIREGIKSYGIRNGVGLTIAPTGTTSIVYGNISSGLEPVFGFSHPRNVLQPNGEYKEIQVVNYAKTLFEHLKHSPSLLVHSSSLPNCAFEELRSAVTAKQITVEQHVEVQAACQEWIDASVSKTINCPKDITFEEFAKVYDLAYSLGCKGCTTYTPSEVRGAILIDPDDTEPKQIQASPYKPEQETELDLPMVGLGGARPRPEILQGKTYKVKWPSLESALYVTINDYPGKSGKPFEIFIDGKSSIHADWTKALCLMLSAIMRMKDDVSFVPEELKQVLSAHDAAWVNGTHWGSIPAYIGYILEQHMKQGATTTIAPAPTATPTTTGIQLQNEGGSIEGIAQEDRLDLNSDLDLCPKCNQLGLIHQEGCATCQRCGYSSCA